MKFILALILLTCCFAACAQSLKGTYTANEPRRYKTDEFGYVVFYPISKYPWYFEVKVTVQNDLIDVVKRYVYSDSLARKHYADSSTNTYHYRGKLLKAGDRYVVKTYLMNKPAGYIYINGRYTAEANNYNNTELLRTTKDEAIVHRNYRYSDGTFYVLKEEIEQDLVIRWDKSGIWINNKFYRKEN